MVLALLRFADGSSDQMDPGWPNVLVAAVLVVVVGGAVATIVVYRRARASIRDPRRRPQ
jgi:hypothetical protein